MKVHWCALLLWLCPASASLYYFNDVPIGAESLLFRKSYLFASGADAAHSSYIKFALHIVARSHMAVGTTVQVGVVTAAQFQALGYTPFDATRKVYCCDASAVEAGFCKAGAEQTLILPEGASAMRNVVLGGGGGGGPMPSSSSEGEAAGTNNTARAHVSSNEKHMIREDGIYYSVISSCSVASGEIDVAGVTEWRNQGGYLPGELYRNLPFWLGMSVWYAASVFLWLGCSCALWRQLLTLQLWISGVAIAALGTRHRRAVGC